ncbi:hypothetical protein C8A01DRAFT_34842 [Parachaetomium inaequale]|uniref:Uncharacterized protein n=1 Tax=Parachaetomium inaequale TaxID=2588326 RepID=A0AAN6PMC1_9PEZI|nr:hypothetical protein C8A01DRAFT_34842 [Parachaetomium inaequale]
MLSLHTHTPLLIHLHATLYWSDPNSSSSSSSNNNGPHVLLRSQKLAPVAFAADVVVPDTGTATTTMMNNTNNITMMNNTTADGSCGGGYGSGYGYGDADADATLFLRSLDARCLARVRAMTRYTAYRFDKPVNYEVERAFVWAGMMPTGVLPGKPVKEGREEVVSSSSSLSMRGLSGAELGRQVEMVRLRGYRDWVRVEMAVEIEGREALRGRGEVVHVWGVDGKVADGDSPAETELGEGDV